MKINEKLLKTLEIDQMQAQVYLAALELGEATMQALARKSGVNRSTIYTFIDELKDRGFILEAQKSKRRMYSAVHPEHLVGMQKARLTELQNVLPELLAVYNTSAKKPRVRFYEGIQGLREVYADMLRERKEIVAYEDLSNLTPEVRKHLFEWFPGERARKDILIKTISRDNPFTREFVKRNRGLLRETKFVAGQEFRTDINIYGDKVALIDLQGNPPSAVLIENRNLAETMRVVWQQLWDKLGPSVN